MDAHVFYNISDTHEKGDWVCGRLLGTCVRCSFEFVVSLEIDEKMPLAVELERLYDTMQGRDEDESMLGGRSMSRGDVIMVEGVAYAARYFEFSPVEDGVTVTVDAAFYQKHRDDDSERGDSVQPPEGLGA